MNRPDPLDPTADPTLSRLARRADVTSRALARACARRDEERAARAAWEGPVVWRLRADHLAAVEFRRVPTDE